MARTLDPTAIAEKWATNLGAANQAYIDGVNAVTVAPGQLAAAAADRWLANTTAAKGTYARNSAAVTAEMWKAAAAGKGAPRLSSGAQAAKPRMATVLTKLLPAIQQEASALPARGDIEANILRSGTFARKMHARKGTFK